MELADWAWARHHNEWSWYIRPLIMIAFCMAAWHRRLVLTILTGVFFPVSAILFPAPEVPKDFVIRFLQAERDMLEAMTVFQFSIFVLLVIGFLAALAAAFWYRSLLWGLLVANLGGAVKMVFGVVSWGDTGWVALFPTLLTAVLFNIAVVYFYWRWQRKDKNSSPQKPV